MYRLYTKYEQITKFTPKVAKHHQRTSKGTQGCKLHHHNISLNITKCHKMSANVSKYFNFQPINVTSGM